MGPEAWGPVLEKLGIVIVGVIAAYLSDRARDFAKAKDVAKITEQVESIKAAAGRNEFRFNAYYTRRFEAIEKVWRGLHEFTSGLIDIVPGLERARIADLEGVGHELSEAYADPSTAYTQTLVEEEPFLPTSFGSFVLGLRDTLDEMDEAALRFLHRREAYALNDSTFATDKGELISTIKKVVAKRGELGKLIRSELSDGTLDPDGKE